MSYSEIENSVIEAADFAAIGAYERDNFGDLLFWHGLKHFAGNRRVIATAPFPGLVDQSLGTVVSSYFEVIRERPDIPFWVVGGEVGGTTLPQALRAYGPGAQSDSMQKMMRSYSFVSPYMPLESGHSIILNSVGLDGLRTLHGKRLGYAARTLKEAAYVSVREFASSEVLRRLRIPHVVAPDAIQTIARWRPAAPGQSDYIIFQMKSRILEKQNFASLADLLLAACGSGDKIILMAAGLAPGHDSLAMYLRLQSEILRLSPATKVMIHVDPDPLLKADLISGANLWIGTSLHGLVISTAYGVPSVSLLLRKLSLYANAWGIPMPVGVGLASAREAIVAARKRDRRERLALIAPALADKAEASMTQGLAVLDTLLQAGTVGATRRSNPGGLRLLGDSIYVRGRILR